MNGNPRRSGRRAPGQDGRDGQSPEEYRELAGLLPAPARPELGQDRHRVLREHMMEHITREATRSAEPDDRATPSLTPLPPPERRFRRLAAPLALVVVVTAGAVVVDQVRDG
ncbi:hypothetical protein ABZY90_30535, partial [Streptomyces sp. NPDC006422]